MYIIASNCIFDVIYYIYIHMFIYMYKELFPHTDSPCISTSSIPDGAPWSVIAPCETQWDTTRLRLQPRKWTWLVYHWIESVVWCSYLFQLLCLLSGREWQTSLALNHDRHDQCKATEDRPCHPTFFHLGSDVLVVACLQDWSTNPLMLRMSDPYYVSIWRFPYVGVPTNHPF